MIKQLRVLAGIALLLVFSSSGMARELMIEIEKGLDDAVSIAVVPFLWEGEDRAPLDIAGVIAADLQRSGQFKSLPRGDMLSRPAVREDVYFRDWRLVGVSYLVIGRMHRKTNDSYTVEYELYDAVSQKQVSNGQAAGKNLRAISHYISDLVYAKLTGVRGVFSTKLMYVTMQGEPGGEQKFRLHISDADGYNDKVLIESPEPILSPNWSPDSRLVSYVSFQEGRPFIYIQDVMTGKQKQVTRFKGLNGAPAFSPDGKKLAMVLSKDGNPEIYVMDISDGALKRITRNYSIDTEPAWVPGGESLIYTSNRGGSPQLYKQNLNTGKVRRLTYQGNYNARGTLTADGRYLVMAHRQEGKSQFQIAVKDLARDTFSILTDSELDESPSIAPNRSMVIYATTDDRGLGVLRTVSMDGRVKVNLPTSVGAVREPVWSPFRD